MDITKSVVSFASAAAVVDLSNSFVNTIISPITSSALKTVNAENLSEWKIGNILIGSFIESIIKCAFILIIVYFLFKIINTTNIVLS